MASTARIDELKKKFDENPRRYFAPLANEFRKAGDIEQAIVICEEFLPQQPGHMSGHIVYGQALFEAGRLPEARTVFETALALDPENLIALRHLGDIAHGQGDDSSARGWYLRVLEADPRNEEIQALIAQLVGEETAPAQPEAAPFVPEPAPEPRYETPAAEIPRVRAEPVELLDMPDFSDAMPSSAAAAEMADTSVADTPPTPAAAHELIDLDLGDDSFEREGDPPVVPHEPLADVVSAEFTEFDYSVDSIPGLESAHEAGAALEPRDAPIETLDGLENSGGISHEELAAEELAAEELTTEEPTTEEFETLDFEISEPAVEEEVLADAPSAPEAELEIPQELPPEVIAAESELIESAPLDFEITEPEVQEDVVAEVPPAPDSEFEIPQELPPEVIAAEADLLDAPAPVADSATPTPIVATPTIAPFVTETMAELYLTQGFRNEAIGVYRQLLTASPGDSRLEGIIDSLEKREEAVEEETVTTARDFLSRLASRRPGSRSAAAEPPDDFDFASDVPADAETEAVFLEVETEAVAAPVEDMLDAEQQEIVELHETAGTATEEEGYPAFTPPRATPLSNPPILTPRGSIDALFDNRAATRSEDSAASALAQAFGGATEEAPVITGRPAREATGELRLDSVFRDAPARAQRVSQNFSFDQFFAGGDVSAERPSGSSKAITPRDNPAAEPPSGERGKDDIDQFNSWLQGLKPR